MQMMARCAGLPGSGASCVTRLESLGVSLDEGHEDCCSVCTSVHDVESPMCPKLPSGLASASGFLQFVVPACIQPSVSKVSRQAKQPAVCVHVTGV